jgi:hypothetical protein
MRCSAIFDTATLHSGQRNAYDPWLFVAQTCTVTSRLVSSTSPQVGQLARMVATKVSLRCLGLAIGLFSSPVERRFFNPAPFAHSDAHPLRSALVGRT